MQSHLWAIADSTSLRKVREHGLTNEDAIKKLDKLEEELAGSLPSINYPTSKEK
ncbi:hypothetical protein GCM10027181_24100 [Rheinheimera gaetbuli]